MTPKPNSPGGLSSQLTRLSDGATSWTNQLHRRLHNFGRTYGRGVTRIAFAFVFITFGLQKVVIPGGSPVDEPIMALAAVFGVGLVVPLAWAPIFVGLYEVTMGLCFLRQRLGAALVLFVPHQLIAFSTLVLIPHITFTDPAPFAYASFGAFVLKNVIFIAAFLLLIAHNDSFAAEADQPYPA